MFSSSICVRLLLAGMLNSQGWSESGWSPGCVTSNLCPGAESRILRLAFFCRLRLCLYDISRSLTKVINAKIVIAHVGLDGLSVRHGMTSACFYQVIVASKKSVDEEEGGVQDDDDDDGGYHDNMRLMSVTIYACL